MSRSWGKFMLTEMYCAPQCGHMDFETVIPDRCPGCFDGCLGFLIIATAEVQASVFACQGSHLYDF